VQSIGWNALQFLRHARGFDVLHFMVEPYATASMPVGLPPSFVTVHGTYAVAPFRQRWHTRALYGAALHRARGVVCVSRFTQAMLLEKVDLRNTSVIHNGHDFLTGEGTTRPDDLIVDGGPIVLGVGALKPRKGYHVALRAIAMVRQRFPDLRYYLVGDDSDRRYVESLRSDIVQLGLERHAIITGPVSDRRLRAFYHRADLFLLTPVNIGRSFEGFGIAYLEANAFGKPVVGSLGCGAEEAVEEGVNGLLAPQNDEAAVADRVIRILSDPALARRLGSAGLECARSRTWDRVAQEYLSLYERALQR
jgi:phosphatidylinositol alpha-1,6-mannosyltransferase